MFVMYEVASVRQLICVQKIFAYSTKFSKLNALLSVTTDLFILCDASWIADRLTLVLTQTDFSDVHITLFTFDLLRSKQLLSIRLSF